MSDGMEFTPGPRTWKGEQARGELTEALRKCGDLVDAVEHLQGEDLIEVLDFIDSLRVIIGESSGTLRGVIKSFDLRQT
jgi:hypothetical protein